MSALLNYLGAPFDVNEIKWRIGPVFTGNDGTRAIPLAYLDARTVIQRLDDACGAGGWQNRYPWAHNTKVYCEIGIKIADEWIWKGNGAGDTAYEAEKGAFSDAFKRAAVQWGIGKYLYQIPSVWMPVVKKSDKYVFETETLAQLTERLDQWQILFFQKKGVSNDG